MKQIIELKLTIDNLSAALKELENKELSIETKILLNENRYRLAELKSYSEILLHSIILTSKNPQDN